ncbi:Fc receptor-like protein 5 isoform X2 [Pelodiscus sinensis]|uniref:Fc receptor-like protein 5 isoform X2 n=1 Tax=Pelodiscus sinensis TaxID=13735 RepID=UPI003F6AC973
MELTRLLPLLASLQSPLWPASTAASPWDLLWLESPTARPSAPKLTVSPPHRVFLRGESVTLTCSAPHTATLSRIRFFRDDKRISSRELQQPQYHVKTLQLSSVSDSHTGAYSCGYWETESGQEMPSERSENIPITVTAPLPAPKLTVSLPHLVYLSGEAVTLICSATGSPTVSGIRFFKDSQEIQAKELPSPLNSHTASLPLWSVSAGSAGQYSCESWKTVSGREIKSMRSQTSSIRVTARPPPPRLSLDPPQPIYIRGERVTLRCSGQLNEKAAGYRFFNQSGEQISSGESSQGTWQINLSDAAASQVYTCLYWRVEHQREIPSEMSPPVPVSVTDPPPQPELSVDPPSGVVSEGFSLNITCTAPGDARERRFHFYKDEDELIPGDLGSEISTVESGTGSVKGSLLSFPRVGPNNKGEFTCEYEEKVAGRWVLSPRSQVATVTGSFTMSAHGIRRVLELAVGGSFFLINGLIFLVSRHCF